MRQIIHQRDMKKIFILPALLLLLPLTLSAQEATLAKLLKWLDASKGLQIAFELKAGDLNSKGTYYGFGQMFYLENKDILKAWYDGKDLWVYAASSDEVNLSTPEEEDLFEINPLLNLNRINTSEFTISETLKNDQITLRALPKKKMEIEWLEVKLKANGHPLSLQIKEKGMDNPISVRVITLTQGSFKGMNQKEFFKFSKNKLPNVSVIDLR